VAHRLHVLALIVTAPLFVSGACHRTNPVPPALATATARAPARYEIAETIYDGGFKSSWEDWGWSTRDTKAGPASVDFGKWGGWIVAKPQLGGRYGGVVFRMKPPEGEAEFIEMRVESSARTFFPRVKLRAEHRLDAGDGWVEVLVPMKELDPDGLPFDRIVFRTFRDTPSVRTLIDKLGLTKVDEVAEAAASAAVIANAKSAPLTLDCRGRAKKVSPLIYGVAWNAQKDTEYVWKMGATARRWGGNTTSRYNWQLGNAWNTANDWYFENVEVKPISTFFAANAGKGASIVTVPALGWVAKDTTSSSFPVSKFGAQQNTDGWRKDAGNGKKPDGKPITPPPPSQTSIAANPDFVRQWVEALGREKRSIDIFILDNEPALWSDTHRDVHPEPLTYDELLQKTIDYGTAVRMANPDAVVAAPAEWGWPAYFYSGKDAAVSFALKPDRRAHGDVPIMEWWLRKVAEREASSHTRLIDLFDLHFYPQGDQVFTDASDQKTALLRLRQTRGLWDPTYADESWIKDPVNLLPRMKDWIDKNHPGLGIMIGEWNFGGESHISGGLATAEALGRFAQNDVRAAFYWTAPPEGSPAYNGFRAFRNYDDAGGRFQDFILPSSAPSGTSLFLSRDETGKHVVAIVLNMSPDQAWQASFDSSTCGPIAQRHVYSYTGGATFAKGEVTKGETGSFKQMLAPWSITVLDLDLQSALPAIP
jgi:hypothetical protein